MRPSTVRAVAFGSGVVVGLVQIVGSLRTGDLPGNGDSWALGAIGVTYALLGWWVTGRRPELRIGWLFLLAGVVTAVAGLATWWGETGLLDGRGPGWLAATAVWAGVWMAPLPVMLAEAVPLALLPDGTPRTRRWRVFLWASCLVVGALVVASACFAAAAARSTPRLLLGGVEPPAGSAANLASGWSALAWLLAHVVALVAFLSLVLVRRRASGPERHVCTTVLVGAAVALGSLVATSLVTPLTGGRVRLPEALPALVGGVAIPLAISIGVLRFSLFQIRAFVNRAVLVLVTVGAMVGAYLVILWLVASATGRWAEVGPASVAAAAAVGVVSALVVTSSRTAAQRWFGQGADVGQIARRYGDAGRPIDVGPLDLQRLAGTVRDELRLGSVELRLAGGAVARVGEAGGPVSNVTLSLGGSEVGEMLVAARPGEALSRRDRELLGEIARYVALAAEAISLNGRLHAAQRSLESARADERRRVRRDLHDGLGPALAAIRLKLVAHARSVGDDGAVGEAAEGISDVIREVRRIVDGLQPSAVEDLGLVAALRILVADASEASGIAVTLEAADDLEDLSPTVAQTTYRMVAEAVANVIRHSGASRCVVDLHRKDGELRLRVTDDGSGFDPGRGTGMGLRSIRDRAAWAGGTARIESAGGCGTVVSASVPLMAAT